MAAILKCGASCTRRVKYKGLLQRTRRFSSDAEDKILNVGFIGLGNMGANMAKNMLRKGYKLAVHDTNPAAVAELEKEGAMPCHNPSEVASLSNYIVTMLPNNDSVVEVYQGCNGIMQSVQHGTILIDSSTIDPSISQSVSSAAGVQEAVFFDAPVSGGVNAAKAAQLTFMVGGCKDMFPSVRELLLSMGSRVVLCGPVGSGQIAKLCNNMLLAISMIGTAEAMNLGIRLGLNPNVLMDIVNSSTGRCWSSELYNPVPNTLPNVPSSNKYEGGFGTRLMAKDLGLVQDAATRSLTPIPLGSLAHQIYRTMVAQGFANKDFSIVYQFLKEQDAQKQVS